MEDVAIIAVPPRSATMYFAGGTGVGRFILLKRTPWLSRVLMVAALFAPTFASTEAAAFCRTTTCDPSSGDTCRKNTDGCIRDGVPLRWSKSPIVYRFSHKGSSKVDNAGARDAIRRAFEAWTNVQCAHGRTSLRFQEGDDISEDKPLNAKEADEPFGIYFRDSQWPHDDAEESIALTNQIYGKVTGTIDYADIEINTATVDFSLTDENRDGTDLQAVITHEVGHYIGLAHSTDPDSIMVARYCQAGNDRCKGGIDRARALAADDESALCASYGPDQGTTTTPPAAGCAESSAPPVGDMAALCGLVCVLTALVRRRSRSLLSR
jgi:hypothetical protein